MSVVVRCVGYRYCGGYVSDEVEAIGWMEAAPCKLLVVPVQ